MGGEGGVAGPGAYILPGNYWQLKKSLRHADFKAILTVLMGKTL